MENWSAEAELTALWLDAIRRFASELASGIDRDRTAGLAPPGVDAHRLGTALIWGTERCLHIAGLGVDGALSNEEAIVEPLLAMWLGAIYGPSRS
jgi:hypothetical protein